MESSFALPRMPQARAPRLDSHLSSRDFARFPSLSAIADGLVRGVLHPMEPSIDPLAKDSITDPVIISMSKPAETLLKTLASVEPQDSQLTLFADDPDAASSTGSVDSLATQGHVSFFQTFKGMYPYLADESKRVSSGKRRKVSRGRDLAQRLGNDDETVHFGVGVANSSRIVLEAMSEKQTLAITSENIAMRKAALRSELEHAESLVNQLQSRKNELDVQIGSLTEQEAVIGQKMVLLEEKLTKIGTESLDFERRIRTIRGDSVLNDDRSLTGDKIVKTLVGHEDSVECLDFDGPFGYLVTGSADKTVRVWDMGSQNRCISALTGHTGWVHALQLTNHTLVTGSGDHTLRLWNLARLPPLPLDYRPSRSSDPYCIPDPSEITSTIFRGHSGGVRTLMFDLADKVLISGSGDRTIRQWDMETGQELINLLAESDDLGSIITGLDSLGIGATSSPIRSLATQRLAEPSTSTTQLDNVWDDPIPTFSKKPRGGNKSHFSLGGSVHTLKFHKHALAAGYGDGVVRLWDLRTGDCHRELHGHFRSVGCLSFDESFGNYLFTGSVDKTVKIWDLRMGQVQQEVKFDYGINDLQFSFQKLYIAAGCKDIQVYNRFTENLEVLEGHAKPVRCIKHGKDFKNTLVSGSLDNSVKIWRLNDGR